MMRIRKSKQAICIRVLFASDRQLRDEDGTGLGCSFVLLNFSVFLLFFSIIYCKVSVITAPITITFLFFIFN